MPSDKTAQNPAGDTITFNEAQHTYTDQRGLVYDSVTKLVRYAFEIFDEALTAAKLSRKTGIPVEQYYQMWDDTRGKASRSGTRMHENCENQLLGNLDKLHQPEDDEERIRFRAAWTEVEKIKTSTLYNIQPEKIVFTPRFGIAGTIDLLAQKSENEYRIIDWKNVKELKKTAYNNKTGTRYPTYAIPDTNYHHYALQLSIYEQILKIENYIPYNAKVDKWLFVYSGGAFTYEPVPDLSWNAIALMAYNMTDDTYTEEF